MTARAVSGSLCSPVACVPQRSCRVGVLASRRPGASALLHVRHSAVCHRRALRCVNESKEEVSKRTDAKAEKLMSDLQKGGIDKKTAQRILKVWEETGAASPDQLRKMLLNRSLKTVGIVFVQLLLDAGASWGAFSTGGAIANSGDFFGKIIIEYAAYFLGSYFAIGCFFDFFTIGVLASTAFQYSTNTEAFLQAVRNLAGAQQTGFNLVDKASVAVNTVKVAQALNAISDILKEKAGAETGPGSTLSNLSAYLTLQKAQERGFKPEEYGLTPEEAGRIAITFAKYDNNDDMQLELSEMRRLFDLEGQNLDEYEAKAAIQLLDKNNDGIIQFNEFADWWVKKVKPEVNEVRV